MIIKLIPVLLTIFYIYSIFGMEFFNKDTIPYRKENNPYDAYDYADFTSFGGALLILF